MIQYQFARGVAGAALLGVPEVRREVHHEEADRDVVEQQEQVDTDGRADDVQVGHLLPVILGGGPGVDTAGLGLDAA